MPNSSLPLISHTYHCEKTSGPNHFGKIPEWPDIAPPLRARDLPVGFRAHQSIEPLENSSDVHKDEICCKVVRAQFRGLAGSCRVEPAQKIMHHTKLLLYLREFGFRRIGPFVSNYPVHDHIPLYLIERVQRTQQVACGLFDCMNLLDTLTSYGTRLQRCDDLAGRCGSRSP